MKNTVFDRYKIIETVEEGEVNSVYIAEEIASGNKFILIKILPDSSHSLYETAVKELKEKSSEKKPIDKKPSSPAIVNFCSEEGEHYLILEYKNKESLEKALSYPSIGKILNDRYVVVRGLAAGGFGTVYLCRDLSMPGKYWAIKEMHDEDGDFNVVEKTFRTEAEMLSSLEHPRIPRISDFFVEKEKLYLVMDYVEGETLKKMVKNLKKGEYFSEEQIVNWALCLCHVLDYLHNRPAPIVFRDLKPDNIIVTPEGYLKLIDFGIARLFQGPHTETTKHALLSAGYAPQEQWLGKAEPRSDIYSLGATLYHLAGGVHPRKVAPSFPPVEEFNPSISPLLSKIISKALEPKMEDRFQTVKEMKDEILRVHKFKEAENHLVKAKDHEKNSDFFNANFEYMKALDLFQGHNYEILNSIANCYERLGFNDKAEDYYKRAIKLDIPLELRKKIEEKLKINLPPKRPLTSEDNEKKESSKKPESEFCLTFLVIIFLTGIFLSITVYYVINSGITGREQLKVTRALERAHLIYEEELSHIEKLVNIASRTEDPIGAIKGEKLGLDYVFIIEKENKDKIISEIALKALEGKRVKGTRIIDEYELKNMGENFYKKAKIKLIPTEHARPVAEKTLEKAMAMEYAAPITDKEGNIKGVIYCGKFINKNADLINKIHESIFEDETFEGKPIGTVTIFLDDVRIATNVLDKKENRAEGTRVSQEVYEEVVVKGNYWLARAFVVDSWYIAAYEPIKDIEGNIIGILYTGYLENYLMEENKIVLRSFWAIIFFLTIFTMLSFIQRRHIFCKTSGGESGKN